MIYFTTFILALLLSHIACATATCDDVFSPDDAIMYADAQQGQHALHKPPVTKPPPKSTTPPKPPPVVLHSIACTNKYDNPNGSTKSVTCSNLAHKYPHFGNFPHFPYIGGAWNITSSSSKACGACVNLTDPKTRKTVFITVIDRARTTKPGWYNISEVAFKALNGGKPGIVLQASAKEVNARYCPPLKK